ncbi:hypothetical protein Hanom_Chr10g00958541 [Helianthus anomalus]
MFFAVTSLRHCWPCLVEQCRSVLWVNKHGHEQRYAHPCLFYAVHRRANKVISRLVTAIRTFAV